MVSYELVLMENTNPKYATAHDHATAPIHDRIKGGIPSRDSSRRPSAGRIPTNPAAKGICNTQISVQKNICVIDMLTVPVATAVVCSTTFS